MSKLDELIKTFCPDGVAYKTLGELGSFYGGLTGKSKKDFDNGNAKYITYMNIYLNAEVKTELAECVSVGEDEHQNKVQYGDVLFTGSSESKEECAIASVMTELSEEAFYLNSFCFGFRMTDSQILLPAFSKYLFRCGMLRKQLQNTASGVTRFNVSKEKMANVRVPLPPLEVQEEIVRILDEYSEKNTQLIAALNEELDARKIQYAHYRNQFFNNDSLNNPTTLGAICDFVRGPFGGSLKKSMFVKSGYPVYEQQHAIHGVYSFRYFVDEAKFLSMKRFAVAPGDLIMSCSGTMGKIAIIDDDAPIGIINQALLKMTPHACVDAKYLAYYFESYISMMMNSSARGGAIKNVASVAELKAIEINLPTLTKQRTTVQKLELLKNQFEDYCSAISKEIQLRQLQYEYYRDKLLTFEETK